MTRGIKVRGREVGREIILAGQYGRPSMNFRVGLRASSLDLLYESLLAILVYIPCLDNRPLPLLEPIYSLESTDELFSGHPIL
jgi:hypothetical protein